MLPNAKPRRPRFKPPTYEEKKAYMVGCDKLNDPVYRDKLKAVYGQLCFTGDKVYLPAARLLEMLIAQHRLNAAGDDFKQRANYPGRWNRHLQYTTSRSQLIAAYNAYYAKYRDRLSVRQLRIALQILGSEGVIRRRKGTVPGRNRAQGIYITLDIKRLLWLCGHPEEVGRRQRLSVQTLKNKTQNRVERGAEVTATFGRFICTKGKGESLTLGSKIRNFAFSDPADPSSANCLSSVASATYPPNSLFSPVEGKCPAGTLSNYPGLRPGPRPEPACGPARPAAPGAPGVMMTRNPPRLHNELKWGAWLNGFESPGPAKPDPETEAERVLEFIQTKDVLADEDRRHIALRLTPEQKAKIVGLVRNQGLTRAWLNRYYGAIFGRLDDYVSEHYDETWWLKVTPEIFVKCFPVIKHEMAKAQLRARLDDRTTTVDIPTDSEKFRQWMLDTMAQLIHEDPAAMRELMLQPFSNLHRILAVLLVLSTNVDSWVPGLTQEVLDAHYTNVQCALTANCRFLAEMSEIYPLQQWFGFSDEQMDHARAELELFKLEWDVQGEVLERRLACLALK